MNPQTWLEAKPLPEQVKNGEIVDITSRFPNDSRVFKFPVYFSSEAFAVVDAGVKAGEGNSEGGIVWDICFMATQRPVRLIDAQNRTFRVIITGAPETIKPERISDGLPHYEFHISIRTDEWLKPYVLISRSKEIIETP